jgi:hypothetical protein
MDKNGTTNYRKDGSIFYSDQTSAYTRMLDQSYREKYGPNRKEQFGIIKDNGVLVLPDYNNDYGSVSEDFYGYEFKNGKYIDPLSSKEESFIATIHTHPYAGTDGKLYPGLSTIIQNGDEAFALYTTPGKPCMVMGFDGKIYGAIWDSKGHADFDFDVNLKFTSYSLRHGADLKTRLKYSSKE